MPLGQKAGKMLRALDKFLVTGLGSMDEQTAQQLGRFLRANGFGTAAERAKLFSEEGPEKRYRAYVELRIALEGAFIKLYRPRDTALPEMERPGDHLVFGEVLQTPEELDLACRSFPGSVAARAYLQTRPDLAGLEPETVTLLMANDDLRRLAARALRQAPPERVRAWVDALVRCENGLARRGAYLLVGALEPADAFEATLPSWARPEDQDEAFEALHPLRSEGRRVLVAALAEETPLEARRFALRMLARSAQAGDPDKWAAFTDDDPELTALIEIARFKAGEIDGVRLRGFASSLEHPELRVLATTQVFLEGEIDTQRFSKELGRPAEELPFLLAPLRNLGRVEGLEKIWRAALDLARPAEDRARAVDQMIACGDRRLVPLLMRALADPVEAIHRRALEHLAGVEGLLPVRRTVDLAPLATGQFDRFGTDVMRGFERSLLPVLHRVPDLRLAPYVGYLLRRSGADAVPAAGLAALGEAVIPVLGTLLDHEDSRLALTALRELERMREDPRASALLAQRAEARDPLELALDKLQVEGLAEEAAAELEGLDRADAVPRLLEAARKKKQAREPVLALLTAWGAPETIPFLAKLLGSPVPDMVRGKVGSRETRWLEKSATTHLEAFGAAATDALVEALGSENWTVRHHAAHVLATLGEAGATPALVAAYAGETEPEARSQLVVALGACGGPEAVGPLGELARGEDKQLQLKAIRALAATGLPAARGILEELLGATGDLGLKRELRKAVDDLGGGAS